MTQPPQEIQTLLRTHFVTNNAYGQFATVDQNHVPSVRTVHFQANEDVSMILINTHTLSEKWAVIEDGQHHVAGCYWNQDAKVQFRFQAKAQLMSEHDQDHKAVIEGWNQMRDEVRTAYLLADANIPLYRDEITIDPTPHSPHHGLVVCSPFVWDVFYEGEKAYRFGKRALYTLGEDKSWSKKDVSSLHEKDILLYDQKSIKSYE